MLAIVCEPDHYIAHRTLMGVRKGVGIETCNKIAQAVITNHRNFRDLFYAPVPDGLLTTRQRTAVQATADLCAEIVEWDPHEQLDARLDDLCTHVDAIRGETSASDDLRAFLAELPPDMQLDEVLLYLAADRDDDRRKVHDAYATRTGQEVDTDELVPDRLRIMTMHGAKGLSARVVFIPGLEEDHLPGDKRAPYPGQVLEAARMLYVSITRARLACILSFARNRMTFGTTEPTKRSRFALDLGKRFADRPGGIDKSLAVQTVKAAERLGS
jgi:superfamily I DNA/RNA helicase